MCYYEVAPAAYISEVDSRQITNVPVTECHFVSVENQFD